MKRFITLLCSLICIQGYAQHMPLKPIEVPDFPTNKVYVDARNNITNTINTYAASSLLGKLRVSHEIGLKYPYEDYFLWSISIDINNNERNQIISNAKTLQLSENFITGESGLFLEIGGERYRIFTWCIINNSLMIDTSSIAIEHISISGLQKVYYCTEKAIEFNELEQELWRRCAKEVHDKRKHL